MCSHSIYQDDSWIFLLHTNGYKDKIPKRDIMIRLIIPNLFPFHINTHPTGKNKNNINTTNQVW